MFEDSNDNTPSIGMTPSSISISSSGMMNAMYSVTFGNGSFIIEPPSPRHADKAFPVISYISIEALLYQQQSSNPAISPTNMMSGAHIGQQVISGQYTMQDTDRTNRYQMGFQSTQ